MAREGVNANQVFASGFPDSTNESDLYLFFGSYGEVTSVKLLINKKTNSLSGAFITFRDCRCAELVLEDQKRRQMFFKNAKINVREAYRDRQGGGGGGFQRQGSHQGGQPQQQQQHAGGDRRNFNNDRSGGYDRGYSGGNQDSNKNPFLQSPIFTASSGSGMAGNNRSSNQYGSSNVGQSQGYSADNRRDDGYRRNDNYNQGYSNTGARQQQGYSDNYNRSSQGNYSSGIDTSRQYDDQNRSNQDDYNRSSSRMDSSFNRDSSRIQSENSGSWADIMDREDRFGDRRADNRSFDRSRDTSGVGGSSYNRDTSVAVRSDNYGDSYNRGGYDNRQSGYDSGRSTATGGYDNQRGNTGFDNSRQGYDSYRSSQSTDNFRSQPATTYNDPGRYSSTTRDSRSGSYGREPEKSSGFTRTDNIGRSQERFEQRDSRKRGSEWVGGYEEVVPRKQMATPGRDDRPSNFSQRSEGNPNPFLQSLSHVEARSTGAGPGATSTPRDNRGFEQRPANRGRNFDQRRDARSGFVGGPDRKDRTSARGARGGARRITARGGANTGPNTRQPVNQGRQQITRITGQARPSDRRGWVGGGTMDTSQSPTRLMAGNISPTAGLNQGNLMQQQGVMGGGMNQQMMQQQQQLQQMQLMRQQQQQMAMQQQRGQMMGTPIGGGSGGMSGIMSTLATLLQNLSKGRGAQQGQVQQNIMRQLKPLERDVVAEVKRSLNVEETPLFASAIMMMRPMDDEVIKIFTQLPQGILMKILRGAGPDVIAEELAKVRNTKSYDNRIEARFHVLRKLLIVLYKVSREQVRPLVASVRPIMQIRKPLDVSRQRLLLAKRRLNMRGGRGGFVRGGRGGFAARSTKPTEKKEDKKDDKATKGTEKKEENKTEVKKEGASTPRGRGAFRRGFGPRGRGGFRGRGIMRGNMRGRGTFRGRGNFRGRGRGGAAKPNGEAKKTETKTTTPAKKTAATTPKAAIKKPATNGAPKKATTPAAKKTPVTRKTVSATAKKTTPAKTTPKTTPAKTTPGKTTAAAKTTPSKTPTKK